MKRSIVHWPDPVLTTPTRPVTDFGADLQQLLDEMTEAMHAAEGIGIAANQVGVPLRVALVGRGDGSYFEIVNPEILETSEPVSYREGCLSVPGEWAECPRFRRVRVRYQDRVGASLELDAEDRVAHVLQHEIDHLDGRVYVDRLSPLKRRLVRERTISRKRRLSRRP